MSALTLGTSTLRTVLASPTLQLDNISELTSALDDQLVAAQDVSGAVDAVSAPERKALDDEVDEEWQRMVREEEEAAAEEQKRQEQEQERDRERERVEAGKKKLEELGPERSAPTAGVVSEQPKAAVSGSTPAAQSAGKPGAERIPAQ